MITEQDEKFYQWFVKMVKEIEEAENRQLYVMEDLLATEIDKRLRDDKQDNKLKEQLSK